jgi:hypothetical protein
MANTEKKTTERRVSPPETLAYLAQVAAEFEEICAPIDRIVYERFRDGYHDDVPLPEGE